MTGIAHIAAQAAERNLPFLLAGGHAVIMHGHSRNTFDMDLAVRRTDQQAWTELVLALGYAFHHEGPAFLQFNPPNPESLPLDLLLLNEPTFAKLQAASVPGPASAGGARVVSLLHLLAMKCHAIKHGHLGRIVKDADDVIHLVQANRLDVTKTEIRDVFLNYGTADLYENVQRLCAQD